MKIYHVIVEQDEAWYVGRVLERGGISTQGRTLDELVFMVRDAIELMWGEKSVQLELIVSSDVAVSNRRRSSRKSTMA